MFGVWGGNGVGDAGSLSTDVSREGSGREATLGDHGPRRRSTNLQDGFPNCRGPEELSCQGLSGTGSNADGDAGPFPTRSCQVHRDHIGGGKPHPPTVPLVQHDGAL